MPQFISLTTLFSSLVVLGAAQACWYYVYLESPYDYYFRYCNSGCAALDENGDDFKQCCMPYTAGQTTPGLCATLSSSVSAAGTACTWGDVATTDSPVTISQAVDPAYVPPAYTPPTTTTKVHTTISSNDPGSTETAQPGVVTETFWITSTSTTPCATASESPVQTTTSTISSETTGSAEETASTTEATSTPTAVTSPSETPTATTSDNTCNCGWTSDAADATAWEGNTPPATFSGDTRRRAARRGILRGRDYCDCSGGDTTTEPTSTSKTSTSENASPTETPTATTSDNTCDCGKTSDAADATAWEGNTPPATFSGDTRRRAARRGILRGRDYCDCSGGDTTTEPTSTSKTSTSENASPTETPTATTSDNTCDCGKTSDAADATAWEGNTPPATFSGDTRRRAARRGILRGRDYCDCSGGDTTTEPTSTSKTSTSENASPTETPTATTSDNTCDCGKTSDAADATAWEGNTPPATFSGDTRRRAARRGILRGRDYCDCSGGDTTTEPTSTSKTSTSENASPTEMPTATTSDNTCDCGSTSDAADATAWEGNTPPATVSADTRRRSSRRGILKGRDDCDCSGGDTTGGIATHTYGGAEGNTAPATWTGGDNRRAFEPRNTAPPSFSADTRKRALVRAAVDLSNSDNHKRTKVENRQYKGIFRGASTGGENGKRAGVAEKQSSNGIGRSSREERQAIPFPDTTAAPVLERDLPSGFSRSYNKRETASTTTCTSTTWVTTDDCAGAVGPTPTTNATGTSPGATDTAGTTEEAAGATTTTAWEGNTAPATFSADTRKRKYGL